MLPSPQRFADAAWRARLAACTSLAFGRDDAKTLRRWRNAFEAQLDTIHAQGFDEGCTDVMQSYSPKPTDRCAAGSRAGTMGEPARVPIRAATYTV
ncbi:hypothetical protein [Paraburkholderia sp. SG-MS1]|uniref:hypothetical protein n=1 Tax=Paraburkholderia sp. SG-MS1 TaxID=2023741 RepID=UPI001446977C|nr:hypothetical protein [Paraburkholderia sp. SG-MS1]